MPLNSQRFTSVNGSKIKMVSFTHPGGDAYPFGKRFAPVSACFFYQSYIDFAPKPMPKTIL